MSRFALTFDDGPDPVWTPRLLDLLAELNARATFFVVGERAAGHPRLMQRMRGDGHGIGLHCDEHVRHSRRDESWLRRDTTSALRKLAAVGVRPTLWRTPWGDTAAWTERVAADHGLRLTGWTVDTHDWRGDSAEQMLQLTAPAIEPESIVLAHDGIGPGARRRDASETVRYVRLVTRYARHQDLQPMSL